MSLPNSLSRQPTSPGRLEETSIGPRKNSYLPSDYEVRIGAISGWIGSMVGIEVKPPVGMLNASNIQSACREAGIGLGAAHFGGPSTFFELDTAIGTLGDGENVVTPGRVAADIIASTLRDNEPQSLVVVNNIVYVGADSLFEKAQPWKGTQD